MSTHFYTFGSSLRWTMNDDWPQLTYIYNSERERETHNQNIIINK